MNARARRPGEIAAAFPAAYALVADKFRVDELYGAIVVRPFDWLAASSGRSWTSSSSTGS